MAPQILKKNNEGDGMSYELETLCRAYIDSDQWGREHIMDTALEQGGRKSKARASSALRLVSSALVDSTLDPLDEVVYGLPLSVIRKAVDAK